MLEQHGDVVHDVQTSSVARREDTVKSVLARAGAAALLLLSLRLRVTDEPLLSIAVLAGAVTALLLSRRWTVERRYPKPATPADRHAYLFLHLCEFALLLAFMGVLTWFNHRGGAGQLWLAAAALLAFGAAHALAIEPAYRRLFTRITAAKTA